MDKTKFKRLLFDTACSAMACDYDIDEREIQELKRIAEKTTYFDGVDLSKRLDTFVRNFKDNPQGTLDQCINVLNEATLDLVQEMLVLEVVLRIVYADTRIDPNEVEFVNRVRSFLAINDEILIERFGEIDFLVKKKETFVRQSEPSSKSDELNKEDMESLENLYFNIDEKKSE